MANPNNILEPIPASLNDYLLKYNKTTLSNTTPAALPSTTNVNFQKDQFGNISACVAGGGTALTLKTNGVANGSQAILNLVAGTNITAVDNGTGSVTITAPNAAAAGAAGIVQMAGVSGAFAASPISVASNDITVLGGITSSGGNVVCANTTFTKDLNFYAPTTATTATAGAASALPATPLGYLSVTVGGTTVKLPYYSV